MNWHATASYISNFFSNCILVDIGSTTTDIIPIKNKKIICKGKNDYERLKFNELINKAQWVFFNEIVKPQKYPNFKE